MKGRKLPRKAVIALIVGGDLLLLLIGWFMLISPQRSTAASIVQATAAAEVQLTEARRPVVPVQPAAAVEQPVIETADLYSLAKAMPSTVDMPNLLLELDQVARSAGVTLGTISPGAPAASLTDGFSTVAINLSFDGDFYSITDMLYRLRTFVTVRNGALQTSGRLFSVGSVGLAPAGSGGLSATVVVNAYVYGPAPAVAAVAVPAETSTDTTNTSTTAAPSADVAPGP
ncbi:MAG: type 4a pilus biogenesis protein PilO [Gaiellaceae bacterium]